MGGCEVVSGRVHVRMSRSGRVHVRVCEWESVQHSELNARLCCARYAFIVLS